MILEFNKGETMQKWFTLFLVVVVLLVLIVTVSCSTSSLKRGFNYGNSGTVTCWSGGTVIYSGRSYGRIESSTQSDGYYFIDDKTKVLVEVSGDCVIAYSE